MAPLVPLSCRALMFGMVQGDITVSGTGHYNPKNDALLRLETMTANEVRVSPRRILEPCWHSVDFDDHAEGWVSPTVVIGGTFSLLLLKGWKPY
jgi:hypothetical protein